MKEEVLKLVKETFENEIKSRIHENNYVKLANDQNLMQGHLNENMLENNEYQFGKNVSVDWLRIEELPERTVKLIHVTWGTPLNIISSHHRIHLNDPIHYISGRASDIVFTWKYNEDGLPEISIKEWQLEKDIDLKKYNS